MNGILGASCEFWDEDEEEEDGPSIIRVEEQEWFEIIQNQFTMCIFNIIVVRGVVKNIGLDSFIDDSCSADSKDCTKTLITRYSRVRTLQAAYTSARMSCCIGAGDLGIVFGT